MKVKMEERDDTQIYTITRKNGRLLSIRKNRDRSFFPDEWAKFFETLKPTQKITFDTLINTGARINEARHIRVGDIDFERNNIILRVTKVHAKQGEKNPRPRTISVSSQFTKRLKKHITEEGLNNDSCINVLSKPAANIAMKKALKDCGIKDYYMFSVHNVRKTHGNWLKAMGVDGTEICLRLGHDYKTFLKHYGSASVYQLNDLQSIRFILGDLYNQWQSRR